MKRSAAAILLLLTLASGVSASESISSKGAVSSSSPLATRVGVEVLRRTLGAARVPGRLEPVDEGQAVAALKFEPVLKTAAEIADDARTATGLMLRPRAGRNE